MREPDKRYDIIKPMLNEGKIQRFLDIFHYQKKTVVARDLGKRGPRFDYLIHRVENSPSKSCSSSPSSAIFLSTK